MALGPDLRTHAPSVNPFPRNRVRAARARSARLSRVARTTEQEVKSYHLLSPVMMCHNTDLQVKVKFNVELHL